MIPNYSSDIMETELRVLKMPSRTPARNKLISQIIT